LAFKKVRGNRKGRFEVKCGGNGLGGGEKNEELEEVIGKILDLTGGTR